MTISQPPPTTDIYTSFNIFNVRLRRLGRVVSIIINISGTMKAVGGYTTLFNIPELYRPTTESEFVTNFIDTAGGYVVMYLKSNGDFQLYNGNRDLVGAYCRQMVTFIV